MVGVDFDLALGINLSAIDIFRYIDWSLILLLLLLRLLLVVFMFVCGLFRFFRFLVAYLCCCCGCCCSFAVIRWKHDWLLSTLLFSFVRLFSPSLIDQVLVCVRWLFWYLSLSLCVCLLVLTIFSIRIVPLLLLLLHQRQHHLYLHCTLFPAYLHLRSFSSKE